MKFSELYRQATIDSVIRKEKRAIKRTPLDAPFVMIKATGMGEVRALTSRGWEYVSALSLGRGAGFVTHIMRKAR